MKRFSKTAVGGALAVALCVSGCQGLFERDAELSFTVDAESLKGVDPMELESVATGDPMTVAEAAMEVFERITDPSNPPATLTLTLADVRATVLANNLDLQVALVDPSIAATSIDEEEARFEATFNASARYTETDSPTEVATTGTEAQANDYSVGVNVPLRTGGTAAVDFPIRRVSTNNPFATVDPSYSTDLRFSISQPLLRDAGSRATLHGLRVAKGRYQISSAAARLESTRVLANADRAYWNLYAAIEELKVRQKEYELAMEQLESAENRVAAGDAAEIEIVRAQSGVAERLEGIIRADTALKRQEREFKRLLNRPELPINSPTRLVVTTPPDPVWLDLDPTILSDRAIANRMEMLELELQLAIDLSTIDFEKNRQLPLFLIDYAYTFRGLSGNNFSSALDQYPDFGDWTVGMRAEIPIGNEAARSRVQRAVLTRLQRLATKEQRRLSIRQEVYDALDALDESWQRILAARLEARLNGRNYEGEQRQFDVGFRTSTDVLDAATRLANSQSREIRALADFQIARIDLAFATGTLLGLHRVSWDWVE